MFDSGRRRLLRLAAALPAIQAAVLPGVGVAATRAAPERRALRLVHLHTGERLDVVHQEAGASIPDAVAAVEDLLRDFRTGEAHPFDPELLAWLSDLQAAFDGARELEVISGYRSPRTNAMLRASTTGVARRSLHMQGRAVDVRLAGVPTAALRDRARAMRRGGVGYYRRSDFVHLDTGRPRAW